MKANLDYRLQKKISGVMQSVTKYYYDNEGFLFKEEDFTERGELHSVTTYFNNSLGFPEIAEIEHKTFECVKFITYSYDPQNKLIKKYIVYKNINKKKWKYENYEYCDNKLLKISYLDYFENITNSTKYYYENNIHVKTFSKIYSNGNIIHESVGTNIYDKGKLLSVNNKNNYPELELQYDENGLVIKEIFPEYTCELYEYEKEFRKFNIYDLNDPLFYFYP